MDCFLDSISIFLLWFHVFHKLWRVGVFWLKKLVGILELVSSSLCLCDLWPYSPKLVQLILDDPKVAATFRLLVRSVTCNRKKIPPKNHVASQNSTQKSHETSRWQTFLRSLAKKNICTLPESKIAHENPIFPCKYHQNGGFSMAMLV